MSSKSRLFVDLSRRYSAEWQLSEDCYNDAVINRNMKGFEDRLGVIISSECVYAGYKKMADDLKAATA